MPIAVLVTISLSGNSVSARRKKCGSVSGKSCISPCIDVPLQPLLGRGDGSGRLQPLTDDTSPYRERPRPSRRTAALVITPIIVFVILSTIGDALTTTWATAHPLALLALNARNRIVLLVTNQLDPIPYYVVGTARLLASDPLFFLLGVLYGDAAVRWVERKSKTFGEQIRIYEKLFQKASYPLVFIAPNNFICIFAGAAAMPIPAFLATNVA